MRRKEGGIGFVVMLLVLAVVFFIAMNNFKSVAPAAVAIKKHNGTREAGQESNSTPAHTDSPAAPSRPSLTTMDQNTSDHTAGVQDALSQAN